jgi:dihydrofolate reductase/thymidylate synthase
MNLSRFNIIVAIDAANGIAKQGQIPWNCRSDLHFFREMTRGPGRNAVIMGRKTYESLPASVRPLPGRQCVIISTTWQPTDHPEILIYPSFLDALIGLSQWNYDQVFVAGGEQLYQEAITRFLYLCDHLYVTRLCQNYECDQFFPWSHIEAFPHTVQSIEDYDRYTFMPHVRHSEYEYLDLIRDVLTNGEDRVDRTGVGTRSIFGARMVFDLRDSFPILTTKKMAYEAIIKELLFFISGQTDTKILSHQGVKIWAANTSESFLRQMNLPWREGDMGPGYGFQWRHWGSEYHGCDQDYTGHGLDQLAQLVHNLQHHPESRRHLLTAWNPSQLDQMALPPCHVLAQFNVSTDGQWLDCQLYQRSGDLFLGVPFNITSYALLTAILAHLTGRRPRRLIHILGDAHIYQNHLDAVKLQLTRTPRPFPQLTFTRPITSIDELTREHILITGYTAWPMISAPMAV